MSPSLKRSAPPLHLEARGSRSQAAVAFSLHLLALCALLGATAHALHYLFNEIYLGHYLQQAATDVALFTDQATVSHRIASEARPLAAVPAILLALIAVIASLAVAIAILTSALNSHNQAITGMHILWQANGTLNLQLQAKVHNLPLPGNKELQCRIEPGCYSSHWLVILRLSHSVSTDNPNSHPRRERFCILLARDSLADKSYRHLRLWMRLVAPNQL